MLYYCESEYIVSEEYMIHTHVDYNCEDKERSEIKARPQDFADNICQTNLILIGAFLVRSIHEVLREKIHWMRMCFLIKCCGSTFSLQFLRYYY